MMLSLVDTLGYLVLMYGALLLTLLFGSLCYCYSVVFFLHFIGI